VEKGVELHAGKTKTIFAVEGDDSLVILQNQNAITAFDDPDQTKEFTTKGVSATRTTCRVFELLKQAGIPVAYHSQLSDSEFVALKCDMIALEVIARHYAVGSMGKRQPNLVRPEGELPYRYDQLLVEFFLKTTAGQLKVGDKVLVDGLDAKAGEEDPFIPNPYDPDWKLFHSKKPGWIEEADLGKSVKAKDVIGNLDLKQVALITKRVFWVLEAAWAKLGCRLIDFKIEFGIGPDGQLYVADVIDNDSWRLKDADWKELSKQVFRDGGSLVDVETNYQLVAALAERFRVPDQALVFWRGSDSDKLPEINIDDLKSRGVEVVNVVKSGHKATRSCLDRLSDIQSDYPEGGVILALVGRSNGLGPVLAAHTSWPVVAVPMTLKDFPDDVYSSIRMPSKVPMATVWPDSNAVQYALNILAQSNPLIWAMRQEMIESLDV